MTQSTILIVDDIQANRETLEDLLAYPALDLHYAADGPTALAKALELQPDLILLDVMMPGMDGFEVCARLRADPQLADVPVIMVTALDDRESRLRGIDAGADDFVTKPFDRAELRARIRGILRLNRFRRLQQAGERIREQAELIDLAPDAIIVCNLGQRITHWNPAAGRLYGWSAAEAIGQRADVLLARGETADTPEVEPLDTDEWRGEVTQMTRDERKIIVDSRRKLLRDANGQPKAILTINTDLTGKKQLEAQFLRAQRMESIGTLAGGIAHDLNNILSPIMMSASVLRIEMPAGERERIIDTIEMSANRGAQIVKQVLTFGRGLEGDRYPLPVGALMKEMVEIMRGTFPKNIIVECAAGSGLWPVIGDATQLHQVLLNLCVNARDAMPDGGSLRLHVANLELDASYASMLPEATAPGPHVLLEVSDTGSGIPPEIVGRIFDPFFTTKEAGKGTGLGLSTVHGIVKSHGGFIHVKTQTGKGTTFQVWLPASPDHEAAPADASREPIPAGHGKLVLMVDDEEAVRGAAQTVLEAHGYRVLQAADGTEALAVFAQNSASIAVVLTDLMMPLMDGMALIQALRKMKPGLPIIASTGLGEKARVGELKAMNVKAILTKPYGADALLRAIHEAMHPAAGSPAL